MIRSKADVIIVGSGIAGLIAAYKLSSTKDVILLCKGKITNSNSSLAQGGIAATISDQDSWTEHYTDTINAGKNHNSDRITEELIKSAPQAIKQLVNIGTSFDIDINNNFILGREGGHNKARIVHAGGDATGKIITDQLIESIKGKVTIQENIMVHDLLIENNSCSGVIAKNKNNETFIIQAQHTVLATGGIGNLYTITSNDQTITGDGIAMAYRANAELVDLEFIQFHPTMLKTKRNVSALISEAVRGEGAILKTDKNLSIMDNTHPLKDLAPRDIVARQIHYSIENGDDTFLDISTINHFKTRFPTISFLCNDNSIDINTGKLPITPGAHFIMGGIKTDIHGKTNIHRLFAIGEVAGTGCHGANRLASNSLLEGIFFANNLSEYLLTQPSITINDRTPNLFEPKISLPTVKEIKSIMTENVGIIRNKVKLTYAKNWFEKYNNLINTNNYLDISNEQKILQNLITTGWLITTSALMREESRGAHYREDYPISKEEWFKRYIIRRRIESESN